MPNAYKRQLKDKNQDYIYPVLDPADLSGKLNVSGDNATQAGVEALINKLPTATGTPNDNTYYACQNNDGTNTYYRRAHSGLWNYIKSKITGTASLVTTSMITDKNVTAAKIADSTITATQLASNAVTTAKITDANVTTAKIADKNVTTAKLADKAVTAAKIADGVISGWVKIGEAKATSTTTLNVKWTGTDYDQYMICGDFQVGSNSWCDVRALNSSGAYIAATRTYYGMEKNTTWIAQQGVSGAPIAVVPAKANEEASFCVNSNNGARGQWRAFTFQGGSRYSILAGSSGLNANTAIYGFQLISGVNFQTAKMTVWGRNYGV